MVATTLGELRSGVPLNVMSSSIGKNWPTLFCGVVKKNVSSSRTIALPPGLEPRTPSAMRQVAVVPLVDWSSFPGRTRSPSPTVKRLDNSKVVSRLEIDAVAIVEAAEEAADRAGEDVHP
jgi:hypothetical protein